MSTEGKTPDLAQLLKNGLIFIAVMLLFGYLLSNSSLLAHFNKQWIDLHIRNNGAEGVLSYVLMGAILVAVGGPRQLLAFLGGYAFGFVNGTLYSTLATLIGCATSFYFARFIARPWISRRFVRQIRALNRFVAHAPLNKTVIIRLLPVGSNVITNLLAGVTQIRARYFFLGSAIGYVPQMAIFALMGKVIVVLSGWKIGLSILMFVISSVLSLRLYKQYRQSRVSGVDPIA